VVDNGLHRQLSRCHGCWWESLVLANHCGFDRTRLPFPTQPSMFSLRSSATATVRLAKAESLLAWCVSALDRMLGASTSSDVLLTHHGSWFAQMFDSLCGAALTALFHSGACDLVAVHVCVADVTTSSPTIGLKRAEPSHVVTSLAYHLQGPTSSTGSVWTYDLRCAIELHRSHKDITREDMEQCLCSTMTEERAES
jgi:hypothetical protein